ncbi:hypothetical protein CR970_02530 [Candidatus Saccharibacteria bacterium]|nr:MAG: hypothetical protein CR970_02530 [Candidatus Saccharibacteria bacterium]
MSKNNPQFPYADLGLRLRRVRERLQESLVEASGAVEIEVEALEAIETGKNRPSEDILMLLISHFEVREDEAEQIWELAGYESSKQAEDVESLAGRAQQEQGQPVMVMPGDLRIVYTDMLHVSVNDYGVVMNFMQGSGPKSPPLAIARVGMSREHAQSVLEVLQRTLSQAAQKSLPQQVQSPKKPGASTDRRSKSDQTDKRTS